MSPLILLAHLAAFALSAGSTVALLAARRRVRHRGEADRVTSRALAVSILVGSLLLAGTLEGIGRLYGLDGEALTAVGVVEVAIELIMIVTVPALIHAMRGRNFDGLVERVLFFVDVVLAAGLLLTALLGSYFDGRIGLVAVFAASMLYAAGRRVLDAITAGRRGESETGIRRASTGIAIAALVLLPAFALLDWFYLYIPAMRIAFDPTATVVPFFFALWCGAFLHHAFRELTAREKREPVGESGESDADALEQFSDRFGLSGREREILRELARGRRNAEIAAVLHVAPSTVKTHMKHIFRKTGAGHRGELMSAIRRGKTES